MSSYDDEDFEEREPIEVETMALDQPANCSICGKAECKFACFRCGKPVCYNSTNYWNGSTCGGWILDSWHPGHPQENEFYCNLCLHAGLLEQGTVDVGGLTFTYTDHKTLKITTNGQELKLDTEATRTLVAFLYDQREQLFANEQEEKEPIEVGVAGTDDSKSDLDDLDGLSF